MQQLITTFPVHCVIGILLVLGLVWLKKGFTRSQMWAWLEFQASVNKQANELRERLRQGRKERIALEAAR